MTFFVSGGYSGTNHDCLGFQTFLAKMEEERGDICLTKDLFKLKLNPSLAELYINFTFQKYEVCYISINDHI